MKLHKMVGHNFGGQSIGIWMILT